MKKIAKTDKNSEQRLNVFLITGVIALIVSILCYSLLLMGEDRVLGKYDKTEVYIAKSDIAKGTQVDEKDFKKKSIDTEIVPSGAITDISTVDGTFVTYDIAKNSVIYDAEFQKIKDVVTGTREVGVDTANLSASVNGILRSSDFVDIYIFDSAEEVQQVSDDTTVVDDSQPVSNSLTTTTPTYSRVYVNKVFDSSGNVIANDDNTSIAERFNVTLEESDADYLVSALQQGLVYVTICKD